MHLRRIFFIANILAILILLLQGGSGHIGQASSLVIMQGTFITLWGDGTPDSGESRTAYFLATTQLDAIRLFMDSEVVTSAGGLTSINRQSVVVQGTWLEQGASMQVQSISLMEGENGGPDGVYGPQPWVSILCKFSDVPAEPKDLQYFQGMYSSEFPGLDHHWREQSFDLANLEGSGAFGWYVLPYPRSHYVPPSGYMNWAAAAQDCTAAADQTVNFSPYIGINLMFNDVLDCCA